jgi:hypothetical protein
MACSALKDCESKVVATSSKAYFASSRFNKHESKRVVVVIHLELVLKDCFITCSYCNGCRQFGWKCSS